MTETNDDRNASARRGVCALRLEYPHRTDSERLTDFLADLHHLLGKDRFDRILGSAAGHYENEKDDE